LQKRLMPRQGETQKPNAAGQSRAALGRDL